MSLPHSHVDPDGLQEFSVVFTDRSLNHMSQRFQGAMRDISGLLKEVYGGSAVALIPGGGSYAMEAVARQFGQGRVLVVRMVGFPIVGARFLMLAALARRPW